jgi:putative endopeptidase
VNLFLRAALVSSLVSISAVAAARHATPAQPPAGAAQAGLDVAGMDLSVAPDDDFFRYANGGWLKRTRIPPDRSSYSVGRQLQDLTDARIRALIESAANHPQGADADARKIGDYFASFMGAAAIEARGAKPLQAQLDRIAAVADARELAAFLGTTLRADVDAINNTDLYTPNLLGLWVAQDFDDPSRYSPFLIQGGLDMPDREYYLDTSPHMAEVRDKFRLHVARVLKLAGITDAEMRAGRILKLESRIAEAHVSRADSEQVDKANNHWRAGDFAVKAPGLAWKEFFDAAGLGAQQQFVVWQPRAVIGIAKLVESEPLDAWKDWLAFHAADDMSPFLPKAFVDERFTFHELVLSGTPKQLARWKRGVEFTGEALGEALGRLYVQKHFSADDKARAEAMVQDLLAAFGRRLDSLAWMAPETRARAKAKLAVLKVGVGYPDRWRDYSELSIVRGDAYGNEERAQRFAYQRSLRKLGTPVDRTEWVMTPQLVNAVNLPAMNAMNFRGARAR